MPKTHGPREQQRALKKRRRREGKRTREPHRPASNALLSAQAQLANAKRAGAKAILHTVRNSKHLNLSAADSSPEPFPKSPEAFNKAALYDYSGDFDTESTFAATLLTPHTKAITTFLEHKDAFERAFITGDYSTAEKTLAALERSLGLSLWLFEAKLLVAELHGGLKANREALAHLRTDCPPLIQLYLQFYSMRSEQQLSPITYTRQLDALLDALPNTQPYRYAAAHVRFHLNAHALTDDRPLPYILHQEGRNPIVDRYLALVRVSQRMAATAPATKTGIHNVINLLHEVPDPSLHLLRSALTPKAPIPKSLITAALNECIEFYTLGDYSSALSSAESGIKLAPNVFAFYELQAMSALMCERLPAPMHDDNTISAHITKDCYAVLSRSDRLAEHLRSLRKIGQMLESFALGQEAELFADLQDFGFHKQAYARLHRLSAAFPSPRFSDYYDSTIDAQDYLTTLAGHGFAPTASAVFNAYRAGPKEPSQWPPQVPAERTLRYEARSLLAAGQYQGAIERFAQLLQSHHSPKALEEVVFGLTEAYRKLGRTDEAARLLVDVALDHKVRLTQHITAQLLKTPKRKEPGDIAWPLLSYLHHGIATPQAARKVFADLDTFLSHHGCDRPSTYGRQLLQSPQKHLIPFLSKVCELAVLEHSVTFTTTTELETERLAICQLLLALDQPNASDYADEIAHLTQSSAVRKTMRDLDKSKIYIDVRGIQNSLGSEFRSRFDRYLLFSRLSEHLRKRLSMKGVRIDNLADSTIVISDESRAQFIEMFNEVRSRFISSNEFGLDSYLSVRIRHGTLSGQLRSQFEREHLVTRKASSGQYASNQEWSDRVFRHFGPNTDRAANQALQRFSETVDTIIDEVKREWIQIRGQANKHRGLFDFDYNDDDLTRVYTDLVAIEAYDAFLKGIFDELWRRTKANLDSVVHSIRTTLRSNLTTALDTLVSSVSAIERDIMHGPFGDAVKRVRTALQNEIEVVASWFAEASSGTPGGYTPELLVETAVAQVRNCFPTYNFEPQCTYRADIQLRGDTLAAFVDVLFVLFENIVRHAPLLTPAPTVDMGLDGHQLRVCVDNAITPEMEQDLAKRIDKINPTREPTASGVVRQEGGSGFHKLHKILRHDLMQGDRYSIAVNVAEGHFTVTILIDLEPIRS